MRKDLNIMYGVLGIIMLILWSGEPFLVGLVGITVWITMVVLALMVVSMGLAYSDGITSTKLYDAADKFIKSMNSKSSVIYKILGWSITLLTGYSLYVNGWSVTGYVWVFFMITFGWMVRKMLVPLIRDGVTEYESRRQGNKPTGGVQEV
jgi:hypothetical protein